MAKRACAVDGKEEDLRGGKQCENNHFICSKHIYGGLIGPDRKTCPLDGKALR